MDLSVVVPVKDEAENILPLIREIRAALEPRFDYELIYVDDGSRDATAAMLREAARACGGRLRVLRHEHPRGQSTAIWQGVRAARAPVVVTLDGDGQNDPADLPRLVDRLAGASPAERLELVVGHRVRRNDDWLKRLSSRIANGVRSRVLNDATPDTGCGIKAFRRDAFLALPYFDHMHRFLPALIRRQGGAVTSVPVNHRPRTRGRSKYGINNRLWAGIVDMLGVAWLIRRERRSPTVPEERLD